jgi:hypothetical protein
MDLWGINNIQTKTSSYMCSLEDRHRHIHSFTVYGGPKIETTKHLSIVEQIMLPTIDNEWITQNLTIITE